MKFLIVLCLVVAAVSALPGKRKDYDDVESFFLFPQRQKTNKDVPSVVEVEVGDSDEDADGDFFPSYFRPFFVNPFSFMNFGFSDFFSRPSWFDSLMPKDIPEDAVKNSTSSTKIVDGHKITVNQTTYENEKNGGIYRIQVIEVSPVDNSKESGEKEIETKEKVPQLPEQPEQPEKPELDTRIGSTEEVKPDQNSQDNEIHREEKFAKYELQGDDPSVYNNVETVDIGNMEKRNTLVDLSSDLRVNKLLAENHRRGGLFMVPPEVEVFDSVNYDILSEKLQNPEILDPQDYQQSLNPQFNQQIIHPQFNQQINQPQYNQQINQPQYNQQIIQPQYNQKFVDPQFNQQIVQPQYNPNQS